MLTRHFRLISLAVVAILARGAAGQCPPDLIKGPFGIPAEHGASGAVRAIIAYSPPDGSPQQLIVAGDFIQIGGITVNRIAWWDGTYWHPLDGGTNGPVHALTIWNGNLIVGGEFTSAGGQVHHRVAGWNGNGWLQIGDGIGIGTPHPLNTVNALAVYNNELYAAGDFDHAGALTDVHNVAKLSGSAWMDVGAPFTNPVFALQVFDSDGPGVMPPALFAGGWATTVRKYDGWGWIDLGGPVPGHVRAMTVTSEGLIMGGDFLSVPSSGGGVMPAGNIARWNGSSWDDLGGGVLKDDDYGQATVNAIHAFGGDLIVGGDFDSVADWGEDPVPAAGIARWSGSNWTAFAGGIDSGTVHALYEHNGSLVVGGAFQKIDWYGSTARNIVRHDGASWLAYFAPRTVLALTQYHDRLVAGGYFASSGWGVATNGYHINSWNGNAFGDGGLEPFGSSVNGRVNALKSYITGSGLFQQHILVAAGEFTQAGGAPASRIAYWNESDFVPGSGWSPMGAGFNSTVDSLEHFNGRIVAAGQFTASGATPLNRIARWTDNPPGSPLAWHPMGSGFNGTVRSLKQYPVFFQSVQLVAAGDFTTAGGAAASRIATWTESLNQPSNPSWQPMGAGFNGTVYAVERHNGSTYAAGAFTMSGGTAANRIARWTGSAWLPVGNTAGGGFNSSVYALLSHGGYLYATGAFTSADGATAVRLARWDGSTWSEVDGGLDSYGFALSAYQTEIAVGGEFLSLNGINSSPGVMRLLLGAPWINATTGDPPGDCHALYEFNVVVVSGYGDVEYQWRRNGVPLVDGYTGTGSVIDGADTPYLDIGNASEADEGTYDCIVSSDCGGSSASPALGLEIIMPCSLCPADIVINNAVDVNDLLAVVTAWGACPLPPVTCDADVAPLQQPDGMIDVNDLLAVITSWGPCPVVTGPCCAPAAACIETTLAECQQLDGLWYGSLETCAGVTCPPINDTCEFAGVVTSGSNPFSNTTATSSTSGVPGFTCSSWSRDVWFVYTPTASGIATIIVTSVFPWDSVIEVYTADSTCDNLDVLACNDDFNGYHAGVFVDLTAGATYLIRVASWWSTGSGGAGDLVITGP